MTKTLSLLLASAALTAGLGLPAYSAMHGSAQGDLMKPIQALLDSGEKAGLLTLVDDDEDDDEGGSLKRGNSEDDDDEEDCDDDEGSCNGAAAAGPAPAGSVAPPQNGLFDTGAPQVQVK